MARRALPGPRIERRARVRAVLGGGCARGRGRGRDARGSCSNAWRRCPWRRTRSPWSPRTTAATRSGAPTQVPFDVRSDLADAAWRSTRSRSRDRGARRRRRIRREAPGLPGVRGRGGGRQGARPAGPVGRDALREHAEPQRTAARRCSTWRSARSATARSSACASRLLGRHGRVSDRRVPPDDHAGDALRRRTRSRGSPRAGGAWSRTRRRSRPIAAPAGPRRRRWSSARWT